MQLQFRRKFLIFDGFFRQINFVMIFYLVRPQTQSKKPDLGQIQKLDFYMLGF